MKLAFKIIFWVEMAIAFMYLILTLVMFNQLDIVLFSEDIYFKYVNGNLLEFTAENFIIIAPIIAIVSVVVFIIFKVTTKSQLIRTYWWKLLISGTLMTTSVYLHVIVFVFTALGSV